MKSTFIILGLIVIILTIYWAMKEKNKPDYDQETFEKTGMKVKILSTSKPTAHTSYVKTLTDYKATEEEIKEVEKQIAEKGFWEQDLEWRISTVMTSKIEPKVKDGIKWFITTVKCEQEVMIPAKTIERAIIFQKIYADFQMELWHEQGWASWTSKDSI